MKSARVSRTRTVCTLLAAGLLFNTGCGNSFLGLEDYERDLLWFGLLVALHNSQAHEGPIDGGTPAGQSIPGDPGPEGPAGPVGPEGAAGSTGPEGTIGPEGPKGPTGPAGPAGATDPAGPAFFDIFIDDFFTVDPKQLPVFGELSVGVVSIIEPALGFDIFSGETGAVAFRVVIPHMYVAADHNDVTMRLFFHRTGSAPEPCMLLTLDAVRLKPGFDVERYGSTRWIRVERGQQQPPAREADESLGDPCQFCFYLVVDLPINSVPPAKGLGYTNDLAAGDFLAFEFATEEHDNGFYHLLGVEFFESSPGTAELVGATVFSEQPDPLCGGGID